MSLKPVLRNPCFLNGFHLRSFKTHGQKLNKKILNYTNIENLFFFYLKTGFENQKPMFGKNWFYKLIFCRRVKNWFLRNPFSWDGLKNGFEKQMFFRVLILCSNIITKRFLGVQLLHTNHASLTPCRFVKKLFKIILSILTFSTWI